ncbi:type II secretion system F family protein [Paenibacillus sp. B01]|uniref:type II secretion system F family protein n=1 Tax=Paenibacillus sp. B01 TaxID=2660554 RepID=UPI00129BEFF0|nr:type II secretion system F family protein [Paenibacillus sp. B01]QGG55397.1 pilus assembly protein TadB [Paenibacillus sp. B01]
MAIERAQLWLERIGWPAGRDRPQPASAGAGADYSRYELSRREFLLAFAAGAALVFSAAYLFYLNVLIALLFSLAGIKAPSLYREHVRVKRQERLRIHFKEMLFSLSSSLAAGRSVENALFASIGDLRLIYTGSSTDLLLELERIRRRCANGETLESGLLDFAARSGVDEIMQFTDVFTTCKRTGGDLVEIVRRTSQLIGERIEVNQEIQVLIAQKKFESRIMLGVPFAFLGFLHLAAPDYMAPLYAGAAGYVLITAALLLFAACGWLMLKIMDIRL